MALYHLYRHDAYQYGVWFGQSAALSIESRLAADKSLNLDTVLRHDIFCLTYPDGIVSDRDCAEFFKGFTMSYVELVVDKFGHVMNTPAWGFPDEDALSEVSL